MLFNMGVSGLDGGLPLLLRLARLRFKDACWAICGLDKAPVCVCQKTIRTTQKGQRCEGYACRVVLCFISRQRNCHPNSLAVHDQQDQNQNK